MAYELHLHDSYRRSASSSGTGRKKRKRWLIRNNPGVQYRQSGFGKTEKTEFTGAGILRDAENYSSGRQTDES
ncbi:MAG: hypothetical protein ACK5XN_37195 [Bacteroidota bacterium]